MDKDIKDGFMPIEEFERRLAGCRFHIRMKDFEVKFWKDVVREAFPNDMGKLINAVRKLIKEQNFKEEFDKKIIK